ncbi:hypothetical protein HOY34_04320 [Xinfangfangia sp. D13-10-4-6]|uniref:Hpt domain-containing protein n=1 Tax=Pseudogemmobacter hezensis TaxID=2737662 RepID=UPI001555CB04|nr:Hpt domain-containing protein [Pseudogemmobacter hezensis]NPD14423.1 hypothetical protein [Pseudogemmobacter hezensis]
MGIVVTLQPQERLLHDGEVIASIYRNLGTAAADQMVSRALGELSLALASLAGRIRLHDLASAERQLHKLRSMASNLGLTSLADAAADARCCLQRGDGTAFAAIWARILRIAGRALNAQSDFADQSI